MTKDPFRSLSILRRTDLSHLGSRHWFLFMCCYDFIPFKSIWQSFCFI